MNRAVLVGLALAAALVTFLIFTGPSESKPGFHNAPCLRCLEREIIGLRRQYLPTRMRRLESRLDAQDQYIVWLEERAQRQEARTADLASKLTAFQQCFGEVPLSRYGEELGPSGYLFRLEGPESLTLATTALDVTYPDDPVGVWSFVNICNSDRVKPKSSLVRPDLEQAAHFSGMLHSDVRYPGRTLSMRVRGENAP